MKITKKDGTDERIIITGMIVDVGVVETIARQWKPDLFRERHDNLIAKWCVDYYNKYGKAIGEHIEQRFSEWATSGRRNDADVELMEQFIGELSGEYSRRKKTLNAEHVLDTAEQYFIKVALERHNKQIQGLIEEDRLTEAARVAENYIPFSIQGNNDVESAINDEPKRTRWLWQNWLAYT